MTNDSLIQQWKQGKLEINNINLDNFDKIRLLKIQNLLKDLIRYYEEQKKLMIIFDEGRFKYEEPKEELKDEEDMQKVQEAERTLRQGVM